MSADWPKMSTDMIALVCGVMFASTDAGSRQKVSGSMSANTGMAFQCSIAVALAHIVHGLTMISSPGSMPTAPTAATNPEVQELTVTACLTPKYDSHARSNSRTFGPPRKSSCQAPMNWESTPDSTTALAASTSSLPIELYRESACPIVRLPPKRASVSFIP